MAKGLSSIALGGGSIGKKLGSKREKRGGDRLFGADGSALNALYGTRGGHTGTGGYYGASGGPGEEPDTGADEGGDTGSGDTGSGANSGGDTGNSSGGAQSFDEYYQRLIETLRGYGIELELPTLEELRDQLSAFLRPTVDEAIAGRRRRGETALAELDADAYSRGMGGSSYLSSMKNREGDAVERDVASLERGYTATLAQYLYNASNELAGIQARFAQMRREQEYQLARQREQQRFEREMQQRREQHDREMQYLRMRGYGSSGGAGADGENGSGDAETPLKLTAKEYRANYNTYSVYMEYLSEQDRYDVFHSGSDYWRAVRDDMHRCLTPAAFSELMRRYDPGYSGGNGGKFDRPGWSTTENMFN